MSARLPFLLFLALLFDALPAWAGHFTVMVGGQGESGGYGDYGGSAPLTFVPAQLTITAGDTVTFVNAGGTHNVASDTAGLFRCANGCDGDGQGGTGNPADGWTVTVPFNTPGTFGYHCEVHQSMGMVGTITVNPAATTSTFAITAGITGSWYSASQSGQGFNIEILPGGAILAFWYAFDANGNNIWLVGQGSYSGDTATLQVGETTGGQFPPNFDPDKIARNNWGTLSLTFSDCNTGKATWAPVVSGFAAGSLDLTRLSTVGGMTCP